MGRPDAYHPVGLEDGKVFVDSPGKAVNARSPTFCDSNRNVKGVKAELLI